MTSAEDFCCTCCGRGTLYPVAGLGGESLTRALLETIRVALVSLLAHFRAPFSLFPFSFFFTVPRPRRPLFRDYIAPPSTLGSALRTRVSGERVISNYRELDARRYRARYLGRSEAEDTDICVKPSLTRPRDNEGNLTVKSRCKVRPVGFDFSKHFMNFHRSLRLRIIARTDANT